MPVWEDGAENPIVDESPTFKENDAFIFYYLFALYILNAY